MESTMDHKMGCLKDLWMALQKEIPMELRMGNEKDNRKVEN
jgi:hypothetical protein